MHIKALLFGSLSLACLVGPAAAQNPSAEPNYGEVRLQAGFTPDPRVVALRAGGDLPASRIRADCRGFVTDAPDLKLHYDAGSFPLIISVAAAADTTLVVNGPDGAWHCDDDGGVNGLNPSIRFDNPRGGRYDIWIGTYRAGATQDARLHISEVRSQ